MPTTRRFAETLGPLMARSLLCTIFVTSAISKAFGWQGNVAYLQSKHFFWIPLWLGAALVIEAAGPIFMVLGLFARQAALVMLLYLIPVSLLLHKFSTNPFRWNMGLIGGLLMVVCYGPGRWSLDAWRANRAKPGASEPSAAKSRVQGAS